MSLLDVMNNPWAVTPEKFAQIQEVYQRHINGEQLTSKEIEAKIGVFLPKDDDAPPFEIIDGVAVIPIEGVIAKKMNMFTRISGGVSTELIGQDIQDAVNNPEVNAIILKIDSPGGTVDGTQELANLIFEARDQKPIVAFSDGMMASAAVWIGTAAHQVIIAGPTVAVGSIGVVATHTDISRAEEMRGIKTTEITSSKLKRATSSLKPLSESGEQVLSERVNAIHEIFVGDIAKFRGRTIEDVQTNMADGRMFMGQDAIDRGLVDSMMSLTELLGKFSQTNAQGQEDGMSKTENQGTITPEEFAVQNAAAVDAWKQEGKNAGYKLGLEDGTKTGAEQERARIKAVASKAKGFPGHDALVETLMYDGQTTGDQAAAQILEAERKVKADRAKALDDDAPPVIPGTHNNTEPEGSTEGEDAFNAAIDKYQKEHNCSLEKATIEVSKRPEFKQYV